MNDGDDFLGDFGALGALPVVIAAWLLVGMAAVLGWAIYDALLAGLL